MYRRQRLRFLGRCTLFVFVVALAERTWADSKMVNATVRSVDAEKSSITVKDRRGGQEIVLNVPESAKIRSRSGPMKLDQVAKDQVVIVVYDPDTLRVTGIQIVGQPSTKPAKEKPATPSTRAERPTKAKPAVARSERSRDRDAKAPIRTDLPVGLEVGNLSPEITGTDLAGQRFRLSDYRGRVIVVDFWGDW